MYFLRKPHVEEVGHRITKILIIEMEAGIEKIFGCWWKIDP